MSKVILTFAGSGDTLGSGGKLQTCIHVEAESSTFLMDCGASSLPALKHLNIDLNSIDTIFITHLHGDHFAGIPFFVLDAQLSANRSDPLTVVGPPGIESRVSEAMEVMFPGLSDVDQRFEIAYKEYSEGTSLSVNDVSVTPYQVVHPSGAPPFAVQIEVDGRTVGYSGDTEWTEALIEVAQGCDVFIAEAYFYDKSIPYHLDYATLIEHQAELDCEHLIITHMNADLLDRLQEIDLQHAFDGKTVRI